MPATFVSIKLKHFRSATKHVMQGGVYKARIALSAVDSTKVPNIILVIRVCQGYLLRNVIHWERFNIRENYFER